MENSGIAFEPSNDIPAEAFKCWIHCNYCYSFFFKKEEVMYLLSCHHILCQKCLTKQLNAIEIPTSNKNSLTYKCIMCSKIARARKIGNDMPSHMKELFHPQPWLADLPIERVNKFQSKHRKHLMNAMTSLEKKVIRKEQLDLEKMELKNKIEDMVLKKKHENMKLERRVRPMLEAYKQRKMLEAQQKQVVASASVSASSSHSYHTQNQSYSNQRIPTHIAHGTDARTSYVNSNRYGERTKSPAQPKVSNIISFVDSLPKNAFDL